MKYFLTLLTCFSCLLIQGVQGTRIGIISNSYYFGERELAWRIKIAAESLGWEVFLDEKRGRKLGKVKNLDWVICLIPKVEYKQADCPHYMTIFQPYGYFDKEGNLLPFYEKYEGFLVTIKPESFKSEYKKLFSIPFYPTVHNIEYKKLSLKNLVVMIPVWGSRIKSEKYKHLYKLLNQDGLAKFYGPPEGRDIVQDGYMGKIPFDGVSVIETLQKHGLVLIIHSELHNKEQIPSSRIFEAAAASAVVICDQNQFVKDHFGDSVYYIDTSLSSDEIYKQIKDHIDSINKAPEVALEKAERAHQIFLNKFQMADQLLRLEAMHKEIQSLKNKKDKK